MAYELPEPGKAYLTYKLEDSPDVSVKNFYNQQGKSYTKWRQWTAYNTPEYQQWKADQLQSYQNYMDAYNANYNSEASTRARLEAAKFSGQYLANGIGGSSASSTGVIPPLQHSGGESHISKGLEKMYQSLQFMSAAGIAMKNFGEGKAAMKFAGDLSEANLNKTRWQTVSEQWKGQKLENDWFKAQMEIADPTQYGYSWDPRTGELKFTDTTGAFARNPFFEKLAKNLRSQDLTNALREREMWLKDVDLDVKREYEKETARLRKELLEGQKDLQDVEKEYAESLKRMGIATPIIGALMKLL